MRILCVEDDLGIAAGLETILKIEGHEVLLAHNGTDAVSTAAAHDFDVLSTDLDLPGFDGLEVIRRIRVKRPGLPVVILSGREVVDATTLPPGPIEVLRKPQPPERFLAALERVTDCADLASEITAR